MARRQCNELMAPAREERARRDEKHADALFDKRRESRVDAAFVARVHDMNLHSEHVLPPAGLSIWSRRSDRLGLRERRSLRLSEQARAAAPASSALTRR